MALNKGKVNKKVGTTKKQKTKKGGGKNGRQDKIDKLDVFDAFCYWVVRTDKERKAEKLPKTQGEFAQKHKVIEATLSNWKKQADYEATRNAKMKEKLADKTPEVLDGLFTRCKKYGMGYEVELWLAYVEGWDKKKILELSGKVEFGDGDIRALVQHLPKTKQKLFYDTITKLLIEAETNRAEGQDNGDDGV